MDLIVNRRNLTDFKCDLLVVNEFAGVKSPGGGTGAVDKALDGLIVQFAKEEGFEGQEGQTLLFRTLDRLPAKQVLVIGLGDRQDFNLESVRRAAARSIKVAKQTGARTVGSILHGAGYGGLPARDCAQAIVEGAMLANYSFFKFKKEEAKKEERRAIKEFVIAERDARKAKQAEQGVALGQIEARAAIFARDLVNEPALHATPSELVDRARKIAAQSKGRVKVKVYDKAALEKMGAGGILGVAVGSDHPPYLVHLVWKPPGAKKRVALVGKAITFDSGGLSLKPSNAMETMKLDMAGAAAVLGVFSEIVGWNPKIEVHGIFGACENMPSGRAIKPGDIVRTMSGKTIEILNTDAEGRVTLADSLHYAAKQKPDFMIDLATLTGACMVALGDSIAGVMTNHQKLTDRLLAAGARAGEPLWQLPLPKEYRELTLSKVADLKNIAGKYGGAITAGLFLREFVGDTPWAHLDIAGPSFAERETSPYTPPGGTGFGVRTLLHFLRDL